MKSPTAPAVQIRPALLDEAVSLSDLAASTFPDACPPQMPAADVRAFIGENLSAEAFTGYLTDPRYRVLVAELTGRSPVGYTLLDLAPVEEPPPDAGITPGQGAGPAYLSKMYMLEAARGTGAAAALMRATLDVARQGGHHQVWLGVNQANTRANAFYAKQGFAVVGQRTFAVGGATGADHLRVVDV